MPKPITTEYQTIAKNLFADTHSMKCVTWSRLQLDHSQGFELWSKVLDMTKVVWLCFSVPSHFSSSSCGIFILNTVPGQYSPSAEITVKMRLGRFLVI